MGWQVELRPLIYSRSPAGFDGQTAFTLRTYHDLSWEQLRRQQPRELGDLQQEANSGH